MVTRTLIFGAVLALLATASGTAFAQGHWQGGSGWGGGHGGPGWNGGGRGWNGGYHHGYEFDHRYGRDYYYPSLGFVAAELSLGALSVGFGGGNYYFDSGVWYRPYGPSYVVVTPPLGIVLPTLPPDYTTVVMGGTAYYYADGVYYNQAPGQGYVVVAPPASAGTAQPAAAPRQPDPIIYPRNGQTAAKMENDRRECNSWATTQTNAMSDAKVFQRSVEACMDGRGYTMR